MSDNGFYEQYLGVDASPPAPPTQQPNRSTPADTEQDPRADLAAVRAAAGRQRGVTPTGEPPDLNGQRGAAVRTDRPPSRGIGQPPWAAERVAGYSVTAPPAEPQPAAPTVEAAHHPPAGSSGYPPAAGAGQQASGSMGPLRASIRAADLVKPYKEVPETGWRTHLHRVVGINLGPSPAERARKDLRRRVSRNLRGSYLVAVMQQKGGVGKTTVTMGLGSALARYRDDKVVAIDANPASGNLAKRVEEPSAGTWRGLISDERLQSYSDFRHYLGKSSSSGLEVLGSDCGDEMLTGAQLPELWQRLQRHYPIGLLDCGNQLRDDLMAAVLAAADAVVVVSTTRLDGADGAAETLNWLVDHGYPHLVRSAVIMISDVFKLTQSSSVDKLHEQFEKAVRAVHYVPYDPHLSEATAIDFDRLQPRVRRAFIEAAASVVDGFAAAADKDPGALSKPRQRGDTR